MDLFAISGLINGVGSISFGLLIFYKNWKDTTNRVFLLLMTSFAFWSFSYWYWLSATQTSEDALFWVRMLSIGSLWIPVFYFHWILLIVEKIKTYKRSLVGIYVTAFLFSFFSFSSLFVSGVEKKAIFPFWPNAGPLYSFYLGCVYTGLVSYALYLLVKAFKHKPEKRGQLFYVIFGSVLGFGGGLFNFFLWYNIPILPYGNFLVVFFSICFGYAMQKYRLFNSKTIAAELLTFTTWVLLLVRVLQNKSYTNLVIDGGVLLFSIIAGIFLVRSVSKEVRQKEELEKLTTELAAANTELKRVDAAKSEFVSIVSHQLRTPLTAVKGYISMMQEGTYGKMEENQLGVLEKVFQSSERLIAFINDLLNLNRIEEGRIIYSFSSVDLAQMADDIVFDLKTLADLKKLSLTWLKPHGLPKSWADPDKVRQVMINFIDNSIKYTAEGNVNVTLKLEGDYIVFQVKDTGVGMSPEEKSNLFKKFVRGEGGRTMHTGGTGLGLYVAKLMAEAHKGEISGESEGKGKGSTFTIKIPTEEFAKKNNINQQESKPAQTPTQPVCPPQAK